MHQTTLNDAALALSRVLTFHRIPHSFFGGFAILAKGAVHRESKDLDVLVCASKSAIVSILGGRRDWVEIPQKREDFVAYFWNDREFATSDREEGHMVLVEMFVLGDGLREQGVGSGSGGVGGGALPGSTNTVLRGNKMGTSYVPILSEECLFMGKLRACASRAKSSDVQDVGYLVATYGGQLKRVAKSVDKKTLGLAVRRHPELRKVLAELGVGIRGAVWAARKARIDGVVNPEMWDVQKGLGCVREIC